MVESVISVARDFSRHPGPRYARQGPHSGERFRKMLVKALASPGRIIVDLDGTSGIGSSFLDEAFGGLIKVEGFSPKEIESRVKVKSDLDSSYLVTIKESIVAAAKAAHAHV